MPGRVPLYTYRRPRWYDCPRVWARVALIAMAAGALALWFAP